MEAIEKLALVMDARPLDGDDAKAIAAEINSAVVGADLDDALMQAADFLKTITGGK